MPTPSPESRFSDRVADYIRFRPSYPPAVMDQLQRDTLLSPNAAVADIGSGTGISAEMFLKQNHTVYGVEPNQAMREAAESQLGHYPNFVCIAGTAEATTLDSGSVDLIVAAQAFHWFEPKQTRLEWTRILKPRGCVALIWNERRLGTTPFLEAYEELLLQFGTDYTAVRHENVDAERLTKFFTDGIYTSHQFDMQQHFDFEGIKGRVRSSSYTPAKGDPKHEEMMDLLKKIFENHQVNGQVVLEYDSRLYIGK